MSKFIEKLKVIFNREVCTLADFQFACDYAKTVVDTDKNGMVSLWEMFSAILRYIVVRKFE